MRNAEKGIGHEKAEVLLEPFALKVAAGWRANAGCRYTNSLSSRSEQAEQVSPHRGLNVSAPYVNVCQTPVNLIARGGHTKPRTTHSVN